MFLNNKKNFNNGFSLIEVLVAIFIFFLIGAAVILFQKDVFSFNKIISDNLLGQDEARRALKMMTAEIRSLSPSSVGSYPIEEARPNSFIFYRNIDNDQLQERIRYFLEGTTLKKGVIKPSGNPLSYNPTQEKIIEIIHNIANENTPIFSYYDTNYDGSTPPLSEPVNILAIRLVKITVFIDKNPNRPPNPIMLTTQISMRNLKDNL